MTVRVSLVLSLSLLAFAICIPQGTGNNDGGSSSGSCLVSGGGEKVFKLTDRSRE